MIVYMLDTLIVWYSICLPTLAVSSLPPPQKKKHIHSQREWKSQAPHLNPYGPGGLATTGPLWRVHGDVWKVRGQRVFGKPRFCSRKTRGTAERNLVTSGRTKPLLGSRSYHNTTIPSWFFGKMWMIVNVFLLGVVWRWLEGHNMCFFFTCLLCLVVHLFWIRLLKQQTNLICLLKVVDPNKCWFPICKLLNLCLGPLGHGLKKWKRKPPGAFLKPACWTISWPETHLFYCYQGTPSH